MHVDIYMPRTSPRGTRGAETIPETQERAEREKTQTLRYHFEIPQ